jgi:glucan phosphorylase
LSKRQRDETEIFTIKNARHAEYWQQQAYPVMLVIRTSDGSIRWMDISKYLREQDEKRKLEERRKQELARKREAAGGKRVKRRRQIETTPAMRQIVFQGEPFTALSLVRVRDRLFGRG